MSYSFVTDGGPWINLPDTEKILYPLLCISGTVEIWSIVSMVREKKNKLDIS